MWKILDDRLQPYASIPVISAVLVLLFVLLSIVITSHSLLAFFSVNGFIIVAGGVTASAFMSYDAAEVRKALNAIAQIFKEPKKTEEHLQRDVTAIIYCARLLREKGMRNLEAIIQKSGITDPFVKYGLNMVVSEYSPDDVRSMMETAADACYERDAVPVNVLHAMASHAPAFGMVGTLIGMVAMLCTMNGDMSAVGPSLAVAFLSTLYGVLSARMLYMPAASKLQQEVDQRRFRNYLITEGLVMLVASKTPMYIQDRLNSFLRPEVHDYFNVIKNDKNEPSTPLRHMAKAA